MEHVEQQQLRHFWRDIVKAARPPDPPTVRAVVVTHLLPDRPFFLEALSQVADIACVLPKPKSIDRMVLLQVRDRYPVEVAERALFEDQGGTQAFVDRYLTKELPFVGIDIGGYFAPAVKVLKDTARLIGIVEDTENGQQKYEQRFGSSFSCPVFSVARSPLKNAEDYLVGHSVAFSTEALLRSRGDVLQGRSACVLGYGKVGRSIAQRLRAQGLQIAIHDTNPVPLTEAHAHGFAVHSELAPALEGAGIVMCATGNLALRYEDFKHVERGAYIASVTSSDDELELGRLKTHYERNRVSRDIVRYRRRDQSRRTGHYFFVLNNGDAVNFIHGAVVGPAIYLVQAEIVMAAARLAQDPDAASSAIQEISSSDRGEIARTWLRHFGRGQVSLGT